MEAICLTTLIPLIASVASQGENPSTYEFLGIEIVFTTKLLFAVCSSSIICRLCGQMISVYFSSNMVNTYELVERKRICKAFLNTSWDLQSKEKEGELQTVLLEHVTKARNGIVGMAAALVSGLNFIILFMFALLLNWTVAVVLIVLAIILFYSLKPFSSIARRVGVERAALMLDFYATLGQTRRSIGDIRIFNVLDHFSEGLNSILERTLKKSVISYTLGSIVLNLYQNFAALSVIVGLAVIYIFDIGDIGSLGAVALLLVRALRYSQDLQGVYHNIHESIPYLVQLQELEDLYLNSAVFPDKGDELKEVRMIKFDQVKFRYDQKGDWIIENINFEVQAGELIGIIGPSGAGKSTLVQLLLGIRHPQQGSIYLGEKKLESVSQNSWFNFIKFVPQDPILLRESVMENIHRFDSVL